MEKLLDAVERYYAAFNRKDWAAMLEELADDVVHELNQGKPESGKAAFAKFLQMMAQQYDEKLTDIVVMANKQGNRIAAEFLCSGVYLKSADGLPPAKGQTYRLRVGAFFECNSAGKITRVTNHYNVPLWLQQVQ